MGDSSGGTDSALGALFGKLDNRPVLLLLAVFLGIGGNQVLLKVKPDTARPDPFTGTMGKELEARMMHELDLRLRPHEVHLEKANAGWALIYEMRQDIAVIKETLRQHSRDGT